MKQEVLRLVPGGFVGQKPLITTAIGVYFITHSNHTTTMYAFAT